MCSYHTLRKKQSSKRSRQPKLATGANLVSQVTDG